MLPKQPVSLSLPPPAAIFSLSFFFVFGAAQSRAQASGVLLFIYFLTSCREEEVRSQPLQSVGFLVCGDVHSVL